MRSVVLVLARALFGVDIPLSDFPVLKSVRGLGISDSDIYSRYLERVFTYRNTYYHKEPKLDLTAPDERELGLYDFIICSEVLEHVAPPVERAFDALARLLAPGGVLVLTLPYSLDEGTLEHFPDLREFGLTEVGGRTVLVAADGDQGYRVYDRLSFHLGPGATVEMRICSESDIRAKLASAGLTEVQVGTAPQREYGVVFAGSCSLPIVASRAGFHLSRAGVSELVEQLVLERTRMRMASSSRWVRLGKGLGFGPGFPAIE